MGEAGIRGEKEELGEKDAIRKKRLEEHDS